MAGNNITVIDPPDEDSLGEAMLALSDKQRRFVIAMVEYGGDAQKSAAAAGYSKGNGNHLAVEGHRNMQNPRVLLAIREEADKRIRGGALLGASVLVTLAMNADSDTVRLKAATELLNRGGLSSVQKVEVLHKDERSDKELEAYIVTIAKKHGLDPSKLLGYQPIEGEFTEVNGHEGIEDLLG